MSRTFLNQSTQIGNSRVYDDTLVPGPELEFTGSESSIHDDLNALRSMTQEVLGTTNWYDSPVNTIMGLDSGKLSLTGGTMSGTLDMGGFVISNVATPITGTDIVNANYVGDVVGAAHFRYSKEYAVVLSQVLSGTDLAVNDAGGTNPTLGVDAALAVPFLTSSGYQPPDTPMIADFNLYSNLHLNGQLLRHGYDFEFGSTAGTLRFAFDLEANDVICLISDQYPGLPALGGGGGGGGGGINYYLTSLVYNPSGYFGASYYEAVISEMGMGGNPASGLMNYSFLNYSVNAGTVPLVLGAETLPGTYILQLGAGMLWGDAVASGSYANIPLIQGDGTESTSSSRLVLYTDVINIGIQGIGGVLSADLGDAVEFGGETRYITNIDAMNSLITLNSPFTSTPVAGTSYVSFTNAAAGTVMHYSPANVGKHWIVLRGYFNLYLGTTITIGGETRNLISADVKPYWTAYEVSSFTNPPEFGVDVATIQELPAQTVVQYTQLGNGNYSIVLSGVDDLAAGETMTFGGEERLILSVTYNPSGLVCDIEPFTTAPTLYVSTVTLPPKYYSGGVFMNSDGEYTTNTAFGIGGGVTAISLVGYRFRVGDTVTYDGASYTIDEVSPYGAGGYFTGTLASDPTGMPVQVTVVSGSGSAGEYVTFIDERFDGPATGLDGLSFINASVFSGTLPMVLGAASNAYGEAGFYTITQGGEEWFNSVSNSTGNLHIYPIIQGDGTESPDGSGDYMVTAYSAGSPSGTPDPRYIALQGIELQVGDTVTVSGSNLTVTDVTTLPGVGILNGPAETPPTAGVTFVSHTPA